MKSGDYIVSNHLCPFLPIIDNNCLSRPCLVFSSSLRLVPLLSFSLCLPACLSVWLASHRKWCKFRMKLELFHFPFFQLNSGTTKLQLKWIDFMQVKLLQLSLELKHYNFTGLNFWLLSENSFLSKRNIQFRRRIEIVWQNLFQNPLFGEKILSSLLISINQLILDRIVCLKRQV